MKGNEGPNLTGRRGNVPNLQRSSCCAGTFQHIDVHQCPGTDLQCQGTAIVPSPWIRAQKMCACRKKRRGKSPQQAFLSLWTLFAALCCEEHLAGCRFLEVGQGRKSRGDAFPPYWYVPINPSFSKSLPIPLSVIPKAELSVIVLENPSALSGNGSHVSALI